MWDFISDILEGFQSVASGIQEFITIIDDGIIILEGGVPSGAVVATGMYGGLDVMKYIGALRFIIGDYLFFVTWVTVLIGLYYTIFKLTRVLIYHIFGTSNIFSSITGLFKGLKLFGK